VFENWLSVVQGVPAGGAFSQAAVRLRQSVACWLSTEGSRWTSTRTAYTGQGRLM
jgi:hypothetical protein